MTTIALDQSALRQRIAEGAARGRYMLCNVCLDKTVTRTDSIDGANPGFFLADVTVEHGRIAATTPARTHPPETINGDLFAIAAGGRMALPAFIDCHTHLDKGHILPRTPAANGTFEGALAATRADRTVRWSRKDVATRMDFALRSAFHYGTAALRTHIDSQPPQDDVSWPVYIELRQEWAKRIALQASSLFPIDMARDETFLERMARRVSAAGGLLGAVVYPVPDIGHLLDRMFRTAARHGLDLDFHADETADPAADGLRRIAEASRACAFSGKVLVGHCCSLARQNASTADATLDMVAAAGLSVVALPSCNLFLQDRRLDGTTPRWRGVTLLHEMKRRGIAVALASDNTRDPFHAYGDLDMLDTFRLGTRLMHLDHPADDWVKTVTATPARIMGLGGGMFAAGEPADFILFEGRSLSEVLARAEGNRIVIRDGAPISTALPSYSELDELEGLAPS